MKKLAFLYIIITLFLTVAYSEDNLVFDLDKWYPTCDNFGSFVDTSNGFYIDDTISVHFGLSAKQDGKDWPYIELVREFSEPIVGTDSIQLTYRCDKDVIVKLYQTDLGDEGLQSYALYQYIVPRSKTWKTVTIAVKDFREPDWADSASRAVKLNLDNVTGIYFTPNVSDEVGGEAKLEISELYLIGKNDLTYIYENGAFIN